MARLKFALRRGGGRSMTAPTAWGRGLVRNSRRDVGIAPYAKVGIGCNIYPLLRRAGCPQPAVLALLVLLQTTSQHALRRGGLLQSRPSAVPAPSLREPRARCGAGGRAVDERPYGEGSGAGAEFAAGWGHPALRKVGAFLGREFEFSVRICVRRFFCWTLCAIIALNIIPPEEKPANSNGRVTELWD